MTIELHYTDDEGKTQTIILGKILRSGDQIELEDGSVHSVTTARYRHSAADEDVVSVEIFTQRIHRAGTR